jgi:hypothetical protein
MLRLACAQIGHEDKKYVYNFEGKPLRKGLFEEQERCGRITLDLCWVNRF